jgi:hypothetical protein
MYWDGQTIEYIGLMTSVIKYCVILLNFLGYKIITCMLWTSLIWCFVKSILISHFSKLEIIREAG